MKQSKNLSVITGAIGLALGLASVQVSASDKGLIDSQAINDYTDPVSVPAPQGAGADRTAGYEIQVILDEAYFDYDSFDIAAYRQGGSRLEQTEFAAFEPGAHNPLAWELRVTD
jgi:hypothetical protein